MGTWKTVDGLKDGDPVDAATLNRPIMGLVDRTSYLKQAVDAVAGSDWKSSIRFSARLSPDDVPDVGNVVCIDPETKTFVRALSSMSVFDPYTASPSSYAVGILVLRNTDMTGVVASFGMVDISGFDVGSMLESGEELRDGPYYVSAREPGRMTSDPQGPRVQVGVLTRNPQKTGSYVGDFAFVSPQYGDMLSHRHRSYRLSAKPAGEQVVEGATESYLGRVRVVGYAPDGVLSSGNSAPAGVPRIVLGGEWPSDREVSYVAWLSVGRGSDMESSPPPSQDFSDCWLHWRSSDSSEGSGSEMVTSFGRPVPVGKRGLTAYLDPFGLDDLSSPYGVEPDSPYLRSWTIRMPLWGRGWTENSVFAFGGIGSGTAMAYGVQTRGSGSATVFVPEYVFRLPDENPSPGDVLVVDGSSYVFVDSVSDEDSDDRTVVPIQGSAYHTFRSIAVPISDGGFSIVADEAGQAVYVGASSVSMAGVSLEAVAAGGGTLSSSGGTAVATVADEHGTSLVDGGILELSGLGAPSDLNNGMRICVSSLSDVVLSAGDHVRLDIGTPCPGAAYRYAIEMDEDLNSAYPPVPAKSGSLVWNGVELASDALYGGEASYSIGPDSLYWFDDGFGRAPWPVSFSRPDDPVPFEDGQRLVFHYVSSFHSDTGPVTSIRPAKGSPIVVTRCGTSDPASVGDLELDADLLASVYDSTERGYKAVKSGRNGRLLLGPVVERIVAGPGISMSQLAGQPPGQGTVTISATNASYSGEMGTIALENAKEEMVGMFPYVRLLGWDDGSANIPTGFVAKFQVPTSVADGVYRVLLYATVFGEESFSGLSGPMVAGIGMTYSILPNWMPVSGRGVETASFNLRDDLIGPDDTVSVDVPFGYDSGDGTFSYKGFDPMVLHNDPSIENVAGRSSDALGRPIPDAAQCSGYLSGHTVGTSAFGVRPGYIVAVRLSRAAPSSGTPYTGKLGFMDIRWALSRVDS